MKVICIKSDSVTVAGPDVPKLLKEGSIYTVINTEVSRGDVFYQLLELPAHIRYWSQLFIPLSSIDESTFERNYNKELV